jgi:Domain of unknown function (DUF4387)
MKLASLATLIRSKNAGPFSLTFDIMFPDEKSYLKVKRSGVLNASMFAGLYRCAQETVRFFECDNALAFKFSMPRPIFQGDLGDGDLHGGQQFAPLMDVEVP